MITKIENMSYSYSAGILSLSATCVLYADDGTTVLHQYGISSKCNVADPDMQAKLVVDLTAKAQDVKDTYNAVMATVGAFYPTATDPAEAISLLASDVEGGIV